VVAPCSGVQKALHAQFVSKAITRDPIDAVGLNQHRYMQLETEDINVIMQLVDRDRDGVVSVDDFRTFVHDLLSDSHAPIMR
jgi:hypothetical protein